MLDLNIYPYDPTSEKTDPYVPGLYTGLPPRRAARGREVDRLVLYLNLDGSATLSAEVQKEFLEKVTTVFYNTRGTVTLAMKMVMNQLNDRMLARNVRAVKETPPFSGLFQALVLHGNTIYIAQSGPVHAYVIGKEGVRHFYDPDGGGMGLGTSRTSVIRFYYTTLNPGDRILLSTKPESHWTIKNLTGSLSAGIDRFSRWLLGQTPDQTRFLLVEAASGKGRLNLLPLIQAGESQAETQGAAATDESSQGAALSGETRSEIYSAAEKEAGLFGDFPLRRKTETIENGVEETQPVKDHRQESRQAAADFSPETYTPSSQENSEPWSPASGEPDFSSRTTEPSAPGLSETSARKTRQAVRETRRALAGGLRGWRAFKARITAGFNKLLGGVLPGQADHLPSISTGTLIFIAVAVPLIVVAVATTVYIQNGRGEQYKLFISQAKEAYTQGQAQSDPVIQRVNYEAALEYVNKAEDYSATTDSAALKDQIRNAIDHLDGISRLELKHALPADFDREVVITQIWASQTEDLYLLDSTSGRVMRMVYTRPGYEVDTQFTCGPGMIGSLIIGPLVDIVLAAPGNNFGAVIMGVDGSGNVLYCSLDPAKTTATTLPPPDSGWGKITAITYQSNVLSVLDVGGNAVWRYEGFGMDFVNQPRLFFDNDIPDLSGAIDLAVYMDDLFILNQDGHMILCTYSYVDTTPTRCTNPYPYRVNVPGQDVQDLVKMDAQFNQMQATQPPEPSLYFLDTAGGSIQQFSMSLNFVRRLQPRADGEDLLPDTAPSAFTVTGGRNLVAAYANQVFIAAIPAP